MNRIFITWVSWVDTKVTVYPVCLKVGTVVTSAVPTVMIWLTDSQHQSSLSTETWYFPGKTSINVYVPPEKKTLNITTLILSLPWWLLI